MHVGSLQTPATHAGADAGHTFPQAPQLSGSESRNVHAPLQSTAPSTHEYAHVPERHAAYSFGPGTQAFPQAPQLETSPAKSTQW
jgi:hypothetical protein